MSTPVAGLAPSLKNAAPAADATERGAGLPVVGDAQGNRQAQAYTRTETQAEAPQPNPVPEQGAAKAKSRGAGGVVPSGGRRAGKPRY